MPLYEYQCEGCGERFEVIQKFSDPPLITHDNCGGIVHRLLSASALQFKGSGWYVTDYAKGTKSEADGAGKKAEPTGGASSSESPSPASSSTSPTEKKATPSDTKKSATKNE
jgi:putative FmdB family regulatory protein